MRDMLFLVLGMLLGGAVGALMLCMLRAGACSERLGIADEKGDPRSGGEASDAD